MWGKFFAFAMLILIILVIVQFSTLSDKDVARIKSQIEEQQKEKAQQKNDEQPGGTDVTSPSTTKGDP